MASHDFTVPSRGRVAGVSEDGRIIGDPAVGVEPVQLVDVGFAVAGPPAAPVKTTVLAYDLDAATAVVRVETEDAAWLGLLRDNLPVPENIKRVEADWIDGQIDRDSKVLDKAAAKLAQRQHRERGLEVPDEVRLRGAR